MENSQESREYKKARRQFLKSTRHRPSDEAFGWTAFRAVEKKYKARFPPPDFSSVLDLALLDEELERHIPHGSLRGSPDALAAEEIPLMREDRSSGSKRKAYRIPKVPGLVILPGQLCPRVQMELVRWSLRDHARWPNDTNLDVHYDIPREGLWNIYVRERLLPYDLRNESQIQPRTNDPNAILEPPGPRKLISNAAADTVNLNELLAQPKPPLAVSPNVTPSSASELLPRLRWANIGWSYHWGTKQYDFTKGKIEVNERIRMICQDIVRSVDWSAVFPPTTYEEWSSGRAPDWKDWQSSYEPDAGIVNFYQLKDTLMAHVDRSEVCATSPLVSISLGNAAVFLIGGQDRDQEPSAILLRSGDVIIMAGPVCRRAYHGVPRILEDTMPHHLVECDEASGDWKPYVQFLQTTRINVNVRQVFPKGFIPSLADEPFA